MISWSVPVCCMCAVSSLSFAATVPQDALALDRIYQKRCSQICAPHIANFTQRAKALQKKYIQNSDFDNAKIVHSGLEELKKNNFDWRQIKETSQLSIPRDGWYGAAANIIHQIVANGDHYDIRVFRKYFVNTKEKVDEELSGADLIVFTGSSNRLWFVIDPKTIYEVYSNRVVSKLKYDPSKVGTDVGVPTEVKESEWAQLQNDFKKRCLVACSDPTKKYVQQLDKLRRKLATEGDMKAAVAVYEYAQLLENGNRSPERDRSLKSFEGDWKDSEGSVYHFNDRGDCTVKKANGTADYTMSYTRSSNNADFHYLRGSSGGTRIVTRAFGKLYMIMQDGRADGLRICNKIEK